MSFDFKSAVADSRDHSNHLLRAIVLGPSGAGKSSICGTIGVPTLYLYTSGEDHGVQNAEIQSANLSPVCLDRIGQTHLTADAAYKRLLDILEAADDIKKSGFEAVVIDSATELEAIIRSTKEWKEACLTKDEKHNTFQEPSVTNAMLRRVILALKSLQRKTGCHFVLTCGLDVKSVGDMGEIEEASPRLTGYSVAEGLIQMCGDVLVVGRMTKDGVTKHKLQFMTEVIKNSKDELKRVKKTINFSPRLAGIKVSQLPPFMDASLAEVLKLKAGAKK